MTAPSKAALRASLRAARAACDPGACRAADAAIAGHVREVPAYRGARSIGAYAALPAEAQTATLLRDICATHGWVALPVYADDGAPAFARCVDPDALEVGVHGVRVPPQPWELVAPDALECVLVPGIGFDAAGRRLGRGQGFYDRLLARCTGTTIGLAYAVQVVEAVPEDAHDRRVHMVVTEAGVMHAAAD